MQLLKLNKEIHAIKNKNRYFIYNIKSKKTIKANKEAYCLIKHILNGNDLNLHLDNAKSKKIISRMTDFVYGGNGFADQQNKLSITISLTNLCNLKCTHCMFSCSSNVKAAFLTNQMLLDALELKPDSISLSGGEPLLHSCFWEYVDIIKSKGVKVGVLTNAILLEHCFEKVVEKKVDFVDISLDGYDSESTKRIRGERVFDTVIKVVKNLRKIGVKNISLSMVLTQDNFENLDKFYHLCNELDVRAIPRILYDAGRASSNHDCTEWYSFNNGHQDISIGECGAFKNELFIDEKGLVYPCPSFACSKYCLGSIDQFLSMSDIMENVNAKRFISKLPQNNTYCEECVYKYICCTCVTPIKDHILSCANICCDVRKKRFDSLIWG